MTEAETNLQGSRVQRLAQTLPFHEWVRRTYLWIDREYFSFKDLEYLEPIYKAFPSTPEELHESENVIMKAAQMGGSVVFFTWCLYQALRQICRIGYYLPDQTTAANISAERIKPMLQKNPDLRMLMTDGQGRPEEGNVMTRHLASSTLYFMWTGINITSNTTRTTMRTESTPLDLLVFDEVQGMTSGQIEKTKERMGASLLRATGMVSTARWPEADIHEHFLRTNQNYWHSDCKCSDGVVLSEEWPHCIGQSDGRIFYLCPHCGTEITDPQKGRYVPHVTSVKKGNGFHFAQTLSRRISAASVWQSWLESTDKQNFFNRKLGKPYSNPDEIPISLALLKEKSFNPELSWSIPGGENYMGIDHMGALNVVVIKRKLSSGEERILHLEWIESLDPFKRSGELMNEFDIRYCALENEPNYNEAFRFAKAFPGRVFIVEYSGGQIAGEMLRWADHSKQDPEAIRKTSDEARMQWSVRVDQYKFMSYSLGKIKDGAVKMPDPFAKPLMRDRLLKGLMVPSNIAELFASHLTKVALRSVKDEKQNRYQNFVEKISSEDPHFTYANMCADVAIARAYGTTRLLNSEIGEEMEEDERRRKPPDQFVEQIKQVLPQTGYIEEEVCGNCMNFEPIGEGQRGKCLGERWFNHKMAASEAKCNEYQPQEEE